MPLDVLKDWYKTLDPANPERAAIMFYVLTGGGSRRAPVAAAQWREIHTQSRL